jgi:hypothetical protein
MLTAICRVDNGATARKRKRRDLTEVRRHGTRRRLLMRKMRFSNSLQLRGVHTRW